MHIYIYIHTHTHTHTHTPTHPHTNTYTHIHKYICTCMDETVVAYKGLTVNEFRHMFVCAYACTHVRTYGMYACVYHRSNTPFVKNPDSPHTHSTQALSFFKFSYTQNKNKHTAGTQNWRERTTVPWAVSRSFHPRIDTTVALAT